MFGFGAQVGNIVPWLCICVQRGPVAEVGIFSRCGGL
jgi:hypothetical protein